MGLSIKIGNFLLATLFLILAGIIALFSGCYNINLIVLMSSITVCVLIVISEVKTEKNYFTITNIFVIYWFFYTNSTLINNLFNVNFLAGTTLNVYILHVLALISYYTVYKWIKIAKPKSVIFKDKILLKMALLLVFLMIGIQMYYWIIKFGITSFIFMTKSARNAMLSTETIYIGSKYVLYMCVPLLYLIYIRTGSKVARNICILLSMYSTLVAFITIDRSNLIQALLPLLFLMVAFKKIKKRTLFILGIIGFIIVVDFKFFISSIIFGEGLQRISIKIPEEFFVNFEICKDLLSKLSNGELSFIFGKSYIEGLATTINPLIDIDPLSIWYLKSYFLEIYESGGGLAFSTIGEAYFNFNILGVVLYYCFLGFIAKYLTVKKNGNDLSLVAYSLAITLGYKFFRAEFYSLVKTPFWFWILPLIFIYCMAVILKNIKGANYD